MSTRLLLKKVTERFRETGIPDPEVDAALLLSYVTGCDPLHLRLDLCKDPDEDQLRRFQDLCDRRLSRIPVQYLIGTQLFCGREFKVDHRVLIPRPETELLAEAALQYIHPSDSVLDLCCGSGCLAVTLQLDSGASVTAADLSRDAIAVTEENAARLGASLTLCQGDLWQAVGGERFHVIVSNPPYIATDECLVLQEEVRREPLMALDGGADGYDFYRRIANGCRAHLHPNGRILMEVGEGQADGVEAMLLQAGASWTAVRCDYNDIRRIVEARFDG